MSHGWLGSRGQPRLATNFWTRSWFAAADGWTRLPRKVTRWPPGNVRSRTLADAYGRWFPVRGFCSFRVWPCQTVPQCDWAFRTLAILVDVTICMWLNEWYLFARKVRSLQLSFLYSAISNIGIPWIQQHVACATPSKLCLAFHDINSKIVSEKSFFYLMLCIFWKCVIYYIFSFYVSHIKCSPSPHISQRWYFFYADVSGLDICQ